MELLPALTALALLGIATERALEILINGLKLDEKLPDADRRKAVYHGLAAIFGALSYWMTPLDITAINALFGAWSPLFVGLLVSGGSGCWHVLLKVLDSLRTK